MPKKPTGGSAPKPTRTTVRKPGLGKREMKPDKTTGSIPRPSGIKKGAGKAKAYLAKSSGTTKGEVRGVLQQLRSGKLSKGGAIKALKGGPRAGVPAGNKKKVARAIRRAK